MVDPNSNVDRIWRWISVMQLILSHLRTDSRLYHLCSSENRRKYSESAPNALHPRMLRMDLLGDMNDSTRSSDRRSSIETTPIRNGGKLARKETSKNKNVKLAQIRLIQTRTGLQAGRRIQVAIQKKKKPKTHIFRYQEQNETKYSTYLIYQTKC